MAANEHGRSSAPFASRQRAAFSRELFLSCFCQKSTGAFIETNCLWAQLTTIDKLIMQMRGCVQDQQCGNVENHTQAEMYACRQLGLCDAKIWHECMDDLKKTTTKKEPS